MAVAGDIDLVSTTEFNTTIDDVLASQAPKSLVVDLSGVEFIDSTGLRTLWTVRQRALEASCRLILRSPSAGVMRLLRLTGMHRVFQIEEDDQATRRARSATAT